jgi:hypothetical protein
MPPSEYTKFPVPKWGIENMFDALQSWWQSTSPEQQALIQDAGLVIAALVGGHFLGAMVARALRARNFDVALRPPRATPSLAAEHGIQPTFIVGLLVRLTVWAGAAWWLARQHGQVELATTLLLIIKRTWALATVLGAALAVGRLLAQRLMDFLQVSPPAGLDPLAARNGSGGGRRWDAAGAVAAGVYLMVVLMVLLIAADLFDWPLTRSSAQALWQFAQHLMVAGAALLIGGFGARWAREQVTPESTGSPEKRASQYTALAIVGGTTALAVAVLLSSAGVLIGLAALGLLGVVLWVVRGYLPDIGAGLQLRAHKVRDVWLEGISWQVSEVGFLTTQVTRAGEFWRLPNRLVMKALMHGQPVEATPR